MLLALGLSSVVIAGACGGGTDATVGPSPSPRVASATDTEAYRQLLDVVMTTVLEGTRLLSNIAVQLSANPELAVEAEGDVNALKGSFQLARESLEGANPPPGYQQPHQQMLDALGLYTQAAGALLPGPETQEADYWRFQELMPQAGKNFHGAGASLDELRRSKAGD